MKNKIMNIKDFEWKEVAVILKVSSYVADWMIAIQLYTKDWEYYSDLSRYITKFKYQNYMAVDINNLPNAEEFIKKYNLWKKVDDIFAWFVVYPVYEMNLNELCKRDDEWVKELEIDSWENIEYSNIRDKLKSE